MLSRLKFHSVCLSRAPNARGWRPGPGPCVVSVEEIELAHLARTHRQAKRQGAGFHSSRSPQGEVPECQEALEWVLSLESRDAVPVPPAHVSLAEQASVVRPGLRSAGDSG